MTFSPGKDPRTPSVTSSSVPLAVGKIPSPGCGLACRRRSLLAFAHSFLWTLRGLAMLTGFPQPLLKGLFRVPESISCELSGSSQKTKLSTAP